MKEWLKLCDAITAPAAASWYAARAALERAALDRMIYTANAGALFKQGEGSSFVISRCRWPIVRPSASTSGGSSPKRASARPGGGAQCGRGRPTSARCPARVTFSPGAYARSRSRSRRCARTCRSGRACSTSSCAILLPRRHLLEPANQPRRRHLLLAHGGALVDPHLPELRSFVGSYAEVIAVDEDDALAYACNALCVNGTVLVPNGLTPSLRGQLMRRGFQLEELALSSCSAKAAAVRAAWSTSCAASSSPTRRRATRRSATSSTRSPTATPSQSPQKASKRGEERARAPRRRARGRSAAQRRHLGASACAVRAPSAMGIRIVLAVHHQGRQAERAPASGADRSRPGSARPPLRRAADQERRQVERRSGSAKQPATASAKRCPIVQVERARAAPPPRARASCASGAAASARSLGAAGAGEISASRSTCSGCSTHRASPEARPTSSRPASAACTPRSLRTPSRSATWSCHAPGACRRRVASGPTPRWFVVEEAAPAGRARASRLRAKVVVGGAGAAVQQHGDPSDRLPIFLEGKELRGAHREHARRVLMERGVNSAARLIRCPRPIRPRWSRALDGRWRGSARLLARPVPLKRSATWANAEFVAVVWQPAQVEARLDDVGHGRIAERHRGAVFAAGRHRILRGERVTVPRWRPTWFACAQVRKSASGGRRRIDLSGRSD